MDGCGTMTTSSEAPLRGSMVSMVDVKVGYRTHGRVGGVTVILVGRPEGALGFYARLGHMYVPWASTGHLRVLSQPEAPAQSRKVRVKG